MEHEQPLPEQQQDPAQQIGLTQGEFTVVRSDGTQENGWDVLRVEMRPVSTEPDAELAPFALIGKESPDTGQAATKWASVDTLKSWQESDEEEPEDAPTLLDEVGGYQVVDANESVAEQVVDKPSELVMSFKDLEATASIANDIVRKRQQIKDGREYAVQTVGAVESLYRYADSLEEEASKSAVALLATGLEIATQPEASHAFQRIQAEKAVSTSYERSIVEGLAEQSRTIRTIVEQEGPEAVMSHVAGMVSELMSVLERGDAKRLPNKDKLTLIASGTALGMSPSPVLAQEIVSRLEVKFKN